MVSAISSIVSISISARVHRTRLIAIWLLDRPDVTRTVALLINKIRSALRVIRFLFSPRTLHP